MSLSFADSWKSDPELYVHHTVNDRIGRREEPRLEDLVVCLSKSLVWSVDS